MAEATLLEEKDELETADLLDENPRYGSPEARLERMDEHRETERSMARVGFAGMGIGLTGLAGGAATAAYGLAEGNIDVAKAGGSVAMLGGCLSMMSFPTHVSTSSPHRRLGSYTLFEDHEDDVRQLLEDTDHTEHDYDKQIIDTPVEKVYDQIKDGTNLKHAIRTYEEDGHELFDLWVTAESETEIETIETENDTGAVLTEDVKVPANPIEDGETYHFAGVIDSIEPYLDDVDTMRATDYADALGYDQLTP